MEMHSNVLRPSTHQAHQILSDQSVSFNPCFVHKPVIVSCVRAYSDVTRGLRHIKTSCINHVLRLYKITRYY